MRSAFCRSRPRWKTGCGLALLLSTLNAAAPIRAQVIEVNDDGSNRIFNGPTRHVNGEADREAPTIEEKDAGHGDRFERIARTEGVDARLLRAMAWTESRGRMSAVSPKGALGIMQLMPATAAALGVDPHDPEANVAGGARYFARMMTRFQNVPLALAAYNAGPGAVLRWGGMPPYAETRSYVASILSRWRAGSVMQRPKPMPLISVDPLLIEVP